MNDVGERDVASLSEVVEAVRRLSDKDLLRLRRAARMLVGRDILGFAPEDVVNQALEAALCGDRKWPRDVRFDVFLKNAMRSMVNSLRKKRKNRPSEELASVPLCEETKQETLTELVVSPAPSSEDTEIARELEQRVLAVFDGKDNAQAVLMGRLEGMKAREIRDVFDLTPTQYESAMKAINRAGDAILRVLRGEDE